jgi:thiol-disulfide isomerase/thioredoxin
MAGGILDSTVVQQILNEVPPSSPGWAFELFPRPQGDKGMSRAIRKTGRVGAYLSYAYEALRTHPNESVKADLLVVLTRRAKERGNEARQRTFYTWLQGEYGDTYAARIAARKLNPSKKLKPGKPAPNFSVQALRDSTRTYTPADFEGQYLLLDFWATWCSPCLDAFPTLRKAHEAHGETLTILSISVDRERSTVTDFLSAHDLPGQHAYAGGGLTGESEIAHQFQIGGLPTYVLVGPDGTIVAKKMPHEGEPLPKILDRVSSAASSGDASSEQ